MSSVAAAGPLWPSHPLHSAIDRTDASARGALFDDGLLWLDERGRIVDANDEAVRLLGLGQPLAHDRRLETLDVAIDGRGALLDVVAQGRREDLLLRIADGTRVLASTRLAPDAPRVALVVLRDLDAFAYRRDRALGTPHDARGRSAAGRLSRPDFTAQRRLSPALHRVLSRGERAIAQGARILITGESGTGKSEIARHLHGSIADALDPFVTVNCAALPGAALETALFADGPSEWAIGAAESTVALAGVHGLLARAVGGTLFIDEVTELSASAQARLLGVLDSGRESSSRAVLGDVRIVAASNRNLCERVRAGAFRADLYYRLAVVELAVPPLRDMPELVGHLVSRFLRTINQRRRVPALLPPRLLDVLEDHAFPGNVRELQNLVQRAAIFIDDAEDMESLIAELLAAGNGPDGLPDGAADTSVTLDLRTEVRRYERALIDRAIRVHGSKRRAASALGIDIATVSRKTAHPPEEEKAS